MPDRIYDEKVLTKTDANKRELITDIGIKIENAVAGIKKEMYWLRRMRRFMSVHW